MIDTISRILEEELSYVYCYNCKYDPGDDECEDCHRKYISWSLGEDAASSIAEKIIKALEDF